VTSPIEELTERVTALEHRVREVQATADSAQADAAAARVLAGGADRDVSAFGAKLDIHKALLEALRETQVEQGQRLTGVEGRLTRLEGKVDKGFPCSPPAKPRSPRYCGTSRPKAASRIRARYKIETPALQLSGSLNRQHPVAHPECVRLPKEVGWPGGIAPPGCDPPGPPDLKAPPMSCWWLLR
jgi:hypothetical protein